MATTVLDPVIVTPDDKPIKQENSNIQNAESLVDKLQLLGMIPGPQKYYVQFFTANAGIVTSFGDLVNKIDNGTATRNDYIDVIKDVTAIGTSTAGLISLVAGTTLPGGVLAIGMGLAVLDYLDSKDYDVFAIKNYFLNKLEDITNNQQNKYEAWESLSPEKKAEWINSGGTPLDYDPTLDKLQELNKELEEKIKSITDNTSDWNNANDPSITEEETSSGEEYSVVDVRHHDNEQKAKDEYHAKVALDRFSKGEDISLAEVIQAVEKSPSIMNKLKEVLEQKGNDDVASWITGDGKFKPNTPPDIKERVFLETEEGKQLSTQLGSTIGGSIGSIIIANNDYSNIEKLAISTSTTVIGQNVGEYVFWDSKNGNGSGAFQDIEADFKNTLQGAVVSFAISSFFAKNDTLADILGMDGTLVGGLVDSTVSYTLGYYGSQAVSELFASSTVASSSSSTIGSTAGATSNAVNPLYAGVVGAVGGYLGNAFANKVMGWDSKEEALGASIGSAVGTVAVSVMQAQLIGSLLTLGPVGWIAAVFVVFGGSAIGNVIGGIVGGLFGKKSPPPPKAHAKYEFDEEDESYNLISSGSSDGGNKQAMIDIGKAFANHLENMFKLPGGQLVDASMLPDIQVNQRSKTVTINGKSGSFDEVNDILSHLLVDRIPFINVENGDEYILRALNRTNEKFQEEDIYARKGRGDLEELYENISLASDYSKYKNETVVLVDKNGNLISDTSKLQEINTLFQTIQNIQDETQKEKALKEFLEEYNFVSQKDYVDKLIKENNPVNNISYSNNKIFKNVS